jgi:hypothetical protein
MAYVGAIYRVKQQCECESAMLTPETYLGRSYFA